MRAIPSACSTKDANLDQVVPPQNVQPKPASTGWETQHDGDHTIFQHLDHHSLIVHPQKCAFGQPDIAFLGHQVTAAAITPLPAKVDAIWNFPAQPGRCPGSWAWWTIITISCPELLSYHAPSTMPMIGALLLHPLSGPLTSNAAFKQPKPPSPSVTPSPTPSPTPGWRCATTLQTSVLGHS